MQNGDPRKEVIALGKLFCCSNKKSSIRQMTNNVNQTDLLCFKGKIKNKLFSLNLNGKSNIDYNLNIIISINI